MPEFLQLLPPREALDQLLKHIVVAIVPEEVPTPNSLGRITAAPQFAPHPLPAFPRSTVDGYAVRARDTHGASDSLPAYLRLIGEVAMGAGVDFSLGSGQCAQIHTGGMLPEGADAVVMLEYTQRIGTDEVEVSRAVASGDNVIMVGEDISQGAETIAVGVRLRPAEIGGLMGLGITRIAVARQPVAGILSCGDEIVGPGIEPAPGQVRDVNAYALSALFQEAGAIPLFYGILPDQAEEIYRTASRALQECDLVVITAGSSVSTRDLTSQVINGLGPPGVLVHGVNVKPGKPTILAVCGGKAVIGLPGNPVSALVVAGLFVVPIIEALQGLKRRRPRAGVSARLELNLASQAGREDWVPVRLVESSNGWIADPVFGKSNLIFSLVKADGLVRIPPDVTGLEAGEQVQVLFL